MTTPADLLAAELRRDGARPLLTVYDEGAGGRVELSVVTVANWVAKTANHLVDEHEVEPGTTLADLLPPSWQAAVVALAAWAAGATVTFTEDAGVDLAVVADAADGAAALERLVIPLDLMGAGMSRLVAAQPDAFFPTAASGADPVDAAPVVPAGARVLTTVALGVPAGLGYGLLGPLRSGGSVVIVTGDRFDPAALAGHAVTERVTHTVGVDLPALPRLDG